jgi:alkanesulfonate monooxygenase SsuD/methylene tetrahydromethanopterin reductase-like flavin-dependent oxidoreductase (luciferase family)
MRKTKLDRIWRVPASSWSQDYLKTEDAGDSLLGSGPVADQSGQRFGPGLPQFARSGATRRTLELQAVLARRAMPGIASAASTVVISYVAGGTRTIRVGSGGVMLPNHAPLVIAEQFGTLESLYRGRIDLGLGRAPGTDQRTARVAPGSENLPHHVMKLEALLGPPQPGQMVRAVPSAGLRVPIWLLGSSKFSAQYRCDARFAVYVRVAFCPFGADAGARCVSRPRPAVEQLSERYAMAGVSVFAADTHAEARRLITSQQQEFASLRGAPGPLPPPVDNLDELWSPRWSGRESRRRWPIPWSVLRTPSNGGLKHSSPRPLPTNCCRLCKSTPTQRDSVLSPPKYAAVSTPVSRDPCCDRMLPSPEYPARGSAARTIDRADAK